MIELAQEILLLNLIEAVMTVYIVIDFRKYGKLQVLFALLCCLTTIYLYPLIIPIPVLPQILMTVVNAYVISKIFELDFKFCLRRDFKFFIYIVLIVETFCYLLYKFIFGIDMLLIDNHVEKFIIGIPFRLLEVYLLFLMKNSKSIDNQFGVERLWNIMKFWYLGQVKKSEKKETTEKK